MKIDTKNILLTLGTTAVALWFFRPRTPKGKATVSSKYTEPATMDKVTQKQKDDAIVSLQAMRSAISAKESASALKELSEMIKNDYGLKVLQNKETGKMRVITKEGKMIAEEQ